MELGKADSTGPTCLWCTRVLQVLTSCYLFPPEAVWTWSRGSWQRNLGKIKAVGGRGLPVWRAGAKLSLWVSLALAWRSTGLIYPSHTDLVSLPSHSPAICEMLGLSSQLATLLSPWKFLHLTLLRSMWAAGLLFPVVT